MAEPGAAGAYAELVLPVLLDEARGVYGRAIADALRHAGFDDLPRGSARVLGGIAREGGAVPLAGQDDSRRERRVSEVLLGAGYLERTAAELRLTPRGQQAATVVRKAMATADAAVLRAVGADQLAELRHGLGIIAALDEV